MTGLRGLVARLFPRSASLANTMRKAALAAGVGAIEESRDGMVGWAGPLRVREAAARALGRVGTAAAVQPLKELEERDRSCRAPARQAIAEIQSRLAGAAPGQLSLAGGEAGALSLAEGEAGALSFADEGRHGGPFATGPTEVARDDEADPSGPGRPESLGTTE